MVVLYMSIGKRISVLRKKNTLTQEELAKRINISRAALSHYEKDRRSPDYETIEKLANFFGVTTDYLLGRSKTPEYNESEDKEFQAFVNDPSLERWYRELPKSKEEDLQKLRKMWEIIKSEEGE